MESSASSQEFALNNVPKKNTSVTLQENKLWSQNNTILKMSNESDADSLADATSFQSATNVSQTATDHFFSDEAVNRLKKKASSIKFDEHFKVFHFQGHGSITCDTFIQIPKDTIVFSFQHHGKGVFDDDCNRKVAPLHPQTNYTFFLVKFLVTLKEKYSSAGAVTAQNIKENIGILNGMIESLHRERETRSLDPLKHVLFHPLYERDILPDMNLTTSVAAEDYGGVRFWNEYLERGRSAKDGQQLNIDRDIAKQSWDSMGQDFKLGTLLQMNRNRLVNFQGLQIYLLNACLSTEFSPYNLLQVQPDVDFLFQKLFYDYTILLEQQVRLKTQQSVGKSNLSSQVLSGEFETVAKSITANFQQFSLMYTRFFTRSSYQNLRPFMNEFSKIFYSSFVLGSGAPPPFSPTFIKCHLICRKDSIFTLHYADFVAQESLLQNIFKTPLLIRDGLGKRIDWGYDNFSYLNLTSKRRNQSYWNAYSKPATAVHQSRTKVDDSGTEFSYFINESTDQGQFIKTVLHVNEAKFDISGVVSKIDLLASENVRVEIFKRWQRLFEGQYIDRNNLQANMIWSVYARLHYLNFVKGQPLAEAVGEFHGKNFTIAQDFYYMLVQAKLFVTKSLELKSEFSRMLNAQSSLDFFRKAKEGEIHKYYHRNMRFPYTSPLEFMVANYIIIEKKPLPIGQVVLLSLKEKASQKASRKKNTPQDWLQDTKLHSLLPPSVQGNNLKDRLDRFIHNHADVSDPIYLELVKSLPLDYIAEALPDQAALYLSTDLLQTFFTHKQIVQFSQKYCLFDYILVTEAGPFISNLNSFIQLPVISGKRLKCRDLFSAYLLYFIDQSSSRPDSFRKYKGIISYNLLYLLSMEKAMLDQQHRQLQTIRNDAERNQSVSKTELLLKKYNNPNNQEYSEAKKSRKDSV